MADSHEDANQPFRYRDDVSDVPDKSSKQEVDEDGIESDAKGGDELGAGVSVSK